MSRVLPVGRVGVAGLVLFSLAGSALAQISAPEASAQMTDGSQGNPQHTPLLVDVPNVETMRVTLHGRPRTYEQRDNCPVTSTHTNASFDGGTYTAQGGFAQGEIAAASYTLPSIYFPLKITSAEFLIAQQGAVVTTTTQWSILIWDGLPTEGNLVAEYSSDGSTLAHVVMGPGTRGTNVQVSVDSTDPDQIFIFNPNETPTHTFTIGFRIDVHNSQTANPCFTAPPSTRNAFPATDNTTIGCGTGYGALQAPTENWLYAVNCGANGCPPNGGWTRFSNLQADQSLFGTCLTGCRPRGDWVMRATWDPVDCPPPTGACCFGTAGCFSTDLATCNTSGGSWKGPGTTCGTPSGGVFPGCEGPVNLPPVARAGDDQSVIAGPGQTGATVVLDGSASVDPDAGDTIASYRWSEGTRVIQDGPAFCSTVLSLGQHTLTLTVTDSFGATSTDAVNVVVIGGAACDPDLNQDGNADQADLDYLIDVIAGGQNPTNIDPDFNHDGNADQSDIDALVNVIAGGTCP